MLSCARYDAVIQASEFHERLAVFKVSQIANVSISCIFGGLCMLAALFHDFFFSPGQIVLLALSIFLTGYANSAALLIIKHEMYKEYSSSIVYRTMLTALPQIFFFHWLEGEMGLILGFVTGFIVQAIYLTYLISNRTGWRKSSFKQLKAMAHKYRQFFFIDVPSQFLSILNLHLLGYLLLILYSSRQVGLYFMAFRIASLPLSVFSSSLSQVFFQKASKSYLQKGTFWPEMRFNLFISLLIGTLVFLVLFFLSEALVAYYLGVEWSDSGSILCTLSPMIACSFVYSAIAVAPLVIGKPKVLFVVRAMICFGMMAVFFISSWLSLPLIEYLTIYSVVISMVYVFSIATMCHMVFQLDEKCRDRI